MLLLENMDCFELLNCDTLKFLKYATNIWTGYKQSFVPISKNSFQMHICMYLWVTEPDDHSGVFLQFGMFCLLAFTLFTYRIFMALSLKQGMS